MPLITTYTDWTTIKREIPLIKDDLAHQNLFTLDLIPAASRFIDSSCFRPFGKTDLAENRTYSGDGTGLLVIDDLVSLTSVTVDGTALVLTTLFKEPVNADKLGRPYLWLELLRGSKFTRGQQNVVVNGVWGWPSVPDAIKQLATRLTIRAWQGLKSGLSDVQGTTDLGQPIFTKALTQIDYLVLSQHKRVASAVGTL